MNSCIFIGRIASDLELRKTQNGKSSCVFRLAVKRRFKDQNGERQSDFFQCVAWQQTADFIHNFFHKGDMVGVRGALQNRSYQAQDGSTRYISEIIVDEVKGCGMAQSNQQNTPAGQDMTEGQGFAEITDDELPF